MKQYPAIFNGAKERNPTLRRASAREVARAAIYLASPAASFVSGTNLIVDGQLTKGVSL
jgi:NAD(P)-dependent dehydrogenase (short-subunit alcohol dehydrogenase family)